MYWYWLIFQGVCHSFCLLLSRSVLHPFFADDINLLHEMTAVGGSRLTGHGGADFFAMESFMNAVEVGLFIMRIMCNQFSEWRLLLSHITEK